jgi:hypothetical protein
MNHTVLNQLEHLHERLCALESSFTKLTPSNTGFSLGAHKKRIRNTNYRLDVFSASDATPEQKADSLFQAVIRVVIQLFATDDEWPIKVGKMIYRNWDFIDVPYFREIVLRHERLSRGQKRQLIEVIDNIMNFNVAQYAS